MKPRHILAKNFIAANETYFNRVVAPSLEITKQKAKAVSKYFTIAEKRVHIIFYDREVSEVFSRALEHNESTPTPTVDLTIYAWDSRYLPEIMKAPWDDPSFKKNDLPSTENFVGVYISGEESLNFYNATTKTGYFWSHDVTRLTDTVLGAPFRTILHWFFSEANIHLWHGAVVGENDSAVLLTARSGSGKSTTALSAVLSGMDYLSDDYIAVEYKNGVVWAHSLYHSAKMTKDSVALFPELQDLIWNTQSEETEKSVVFLGDGFKTQIKRSVPLSAILIPQIKGGDSTLIEANPIEALVAIAPTTLLQLPFADRSKLSIFKEIIERLPCYFLRLGTDIRGVPQILKQFIAEHAK